MLELLDRIRALHVAGRLGVAGLDPLFAGVSFHTSKGDGELKNGMLNVGGRVVSISPSDVLGFTVVKPVAPAPVAKPAPVETPEPFSLD
jgi:hypothetical protein